MFLNKPLLACTIWNSLYEWKESLYIKICILALLASVYWKQINIGAYFYSLIGALFFYTRFQKCYLIHFFSTILLCAVLRYCIPLCSTLFYCAVLHSTVHYTLLLFYYCASLSMFYSIILYYTISILFYSITPCYTLLYALLYSNSILFYSTVFHPTLFYYVAFNAAIFHSTLLIITLNRSVELNKSWIFYPKGQNGIDLYHNHISYQS